MPELRRALGREYARIRRLTDRLAHEQAQVEKVTWALERTAKRNAAGVKALARQNESGRPATPEQYAALGQELGLEGDLRLERDRIEAHIQASERMLARAQSNREELELALAVAQTVEEMQRQALVQVRSPRLKAVAAARFIGRLLQARPGLWGGIIRNLYLGMQVVGVLVWMLPKGDRDRWRNESYNELEELKLEGAPLLGNAVRIALRTPRLALELWASAWSRSPAARWLPRLKPVWIGVGTATATFWTGIAGIGQYPTEWQTRKLVAASMLTGVVALTGSFKGRRPRRRRRRGRKR